MQPAVELLAAIPSVIYGLLGMMILNPMMYRLEKHIFAGSTTHQFTGGSNLLSAIIVLAIMILPTVISISVSSLRAVPDHLKSASLALGATHMQTIFKVLIPAAKSGIMTGVVLGNTDRQRDVLCRRTAQTGIVHGRTGTVCIHYDH